MMLYLTPSPEVDRAIEINGWRVLPVFPAATDGK